MYVTTEYQLENGVEIEVEGYVEQHDGCGEYPSFVEVTEWNIIRVGAAFFTGSKKDVTRLSKLYAKIPAGVIENALVEAA